MINKVAKHIKQGTLANAVYKKAIGKEKRSKITGYKRNIYNITRYGREAPRFGEFIWIYPHKHTTVVLPNVVNDLHGVANKSELLGKVIENSWPTEQLLEHTFKITDYPNDKFCIEEWSKELDWEYRVKLRFKFCIEHFVDGIPWEDTGVYEFMETEIKRSKNARIDGCKNRDDIVKRYRDLDIIFQQIKKEGRFRTKEEVKNNDFQSGTYSQMKAIIGPGAEILISGGGWHRFAIGYILELPLPAMIGCVHVSAIPYLKEYRKG